MLIAKGIHKSYGSLEVLKGVDLEISKGEIVSIVGASGAGKSTLLHILGTLDRPDRGELSLNGQNLMQLKGDALAEFRNARIGFVFQFHNLLPEFTALENICIPGFIQGREEKELKKRAEELGDILGISHRLRDTYYLSFVLVTHNEELAAMADRKVVMKDGRIEGTISA